MLSIFYDMYRFAAADFQFPIKAWDSVRREAKWARSLLIYCQASIHRPIHSRVFMSDSCHTGYGVVSSQLDTTMLAQVCSIDERWRFRTQFCVGRNPTFVGITVVETWTGDRDFVQECCSFVFSVLYRTITLSRRDCLQNGTCVSVK